MKLVGATTTTALVLLTVLGLARPSSAQPAWSSTGSLLEGRHDHTATLLPNGNVLVAGGNSLWSLQTAELYDVKRGTWSLTGLLNNARVRHTATLLPSGKVLVVGGDGFVTADPSQTAELFDPLTGTWAATGSPLHGRRRHTATLLANGKVLIAGGADNSQQGVAFAELYDPATGLFTSTGSLLQPRVGHTATLLPSGKVLAVGGGDFGDGLDSAELYDPATGLWTATGSLGAGRFNSTATLLSTGKVLVVGGYGTEASAELYDPSTGNWDPTGSRVSPPSGQYRHTATLLPSGKVLFAGGGYGTDRATEIYDPTTGTFAAGPLLVQSRYGHTATLLPNGRVLLAAGYAFSHLSFAEVFDPAAGAWSNAAPMAQGRFRHSATLLPSGKVLVAGGSSADCNASLLATAQLFDPPGGTWSGTGSMSVARCGHTATLLPTGKVLIAGGHSTSADLVSAELYDPATGLFSPTGSLAYAHQSPTATLLPSGKVLLVGNVPANGNIHAEVYDPASGAWTLTNSPTIRANEHRAALLENGRVLIAGGFYNSAEVYDPSAGTWAYTGYPAIPQRMLHSTSLLSTGRILVVGGTIGQYGGAELPALTEVYDAATQTWSGAGSLAAGRYDHTATLLGDGSVLVAGGYGGLAYGLNDTYELSSAEVFDPVAGIWKSAGSFTQGRAGHTATLLADGRVLLAGGRTADAVSPALAATELFDPRSFVSKVQSATDVPKSIPDVSSVTSSLTVADTRVVADVDVTVNLTHTWDGDLILTLVAPNGVRVTLANRRGASGDNYTGTVFDDEAAGDLALGSAPFTGSFRPESALNALDGIPANGTWGLEAADAASLDTGTLTSWSLTLKLVSGPTLSAATSPIVYGSPVSVTGRGLGSGAEGSDGATSSSAVNYPVFQIRSLASGRSSWLVQDSRTRFSDDPMAASFSNLPPTLDPGWYSLSATANGIQSPSRIVQVSCGLSITSAPQSQTLSLGARASFQVATQGGVTFQWQRNRGAGWENIPGASASAYQTDVITAVDAGARYRVAVSRPCANVTSNEAVLLVTDSVPPVVAVQSPTGGSRLPVSSSQQVIWTATDNIRVCKATASLEYSNNGGGVWLAAAPSGGLPFTVDQSASCNAPGLGPAESQVTYTVPSTFPSGQPGSLYRVRVQAWDLNGNASAVATSGTFYIVKPDPEAQTLILWNRARMQSQLGSTTAELDELALQLNRLGLHGRVRGVVEDVGQIGPLATLYAKWDAAHTGNTADQHNWANTILFGCDRANVTDAYPAWCTPSEQGIEGLQDLISTRKRTLYANLKYVILVGDDRVIPFARLLDETSGNASENRYPGGVTPDLTSGTTVGRALSANRFLSDDPLLTDAAIRPDDLSGLFRPDFSGGRLVENADEIIKTISTFMGQDGVMDLTAEPLGHRVLVTGYDFMLSGAKGIKNAWESVPGVGAISQNLLGESWGDVLLRQDLQGNGSGRFAVMSLNGHASHFLEGVPAGGAVAGLSALDLYGTDRCANTSSSPLNANFNGAVVYSMGCHGGLVVPGSCSTTNDHSLDLPQTFLGRGAAVYLGNTGYGYGDWGVVAYSVLLSDLFTQRLVGEQSIAVGEALRLTKTDSYLRDRGGVSDPSKPGRISGLDAYDRKALMQWTLFGMPMYELRLRTGTSSAMAPTAAPALNDSLIQQIENVRVSRKETLLDRPPQYVTKLSLSFDLSATDVYTKWHGGERLASVNTACPNESDPRRQGCYYRLNNKMTTGSGMPVQPMMVYDSRLSGTSQHGVLWMGGTYVEETNWKPVFGGVVTNGFENSEPLPAPRAVLLESITTQTGSSQGGCRATDDEVNSMAVATGELLKDSGGQFTIERHYTSFDAEILYYNNTNPLQAAQNCQRTGPGLSQGGGPFSGGAYHQVTGQTLEWAVPGLASDVWRVIVVYNNEATNTWEPLELTKDGSGVWRGSKVFASPARVGYVLQGADTKGNVGRLRYQDTLPNSGIQRSFPLVVDANIVAPSSMISVADASVSEGYTSGSTMTFTVSLSAASASPVSVNYATANGTALAGTDYTTTTGTLNFAAGEMVKLLNVSVLGDATPEPNKTFTLNLSSPSGATILDGTGVGTILNDDGSTISVTNSTVLEGTTGTPNNLAFTVVLSATSTQTITVDYATANGTAVAGSDYTAKSGTLTFIPGQASQTVQVAMTQDASVEPDETMFLNLTNPTNATIFDGQGQGTIQSDDGLLVSISDKTTDEGNTGFTPVSFKVTLSAPAPGTVTVGWATADGTATAPLDYTAASGTVTFNAGESSKTVTVQVVGDAGKEPYETFFINLSSPTGGAAIGRGQAQGTITNTDGSTDRSRLMFHNFATNRLYRWHMKNGNTLDTFNWVTPFATDPGWTVGAVADFDQDGQLDYLWHNVNTGQMLFWYIDGDNLKGFQFVPYSMAPPWRVATTFDADGNGTQDIVFYNSTTGVVRVKQHDNATLLGEYDITTLLPGAGTVRVVAAVDANNDGDDELALYNSATGQVTAWNVSGATVTSTITYANTQVTSPAYTLVSTKTDFNNDGLADFLWHNPTPTGVFAVWFMNGTTRTGTGQFQPFTATDPVWKVVGSANIW